MPGSLTPAAQDALSARKPDEKRSEDDLEAKAERGAGSRGSWHRRMSTRAGHRGVYWPLVALVLAGVALRLYVMLVYSTVVTDYFTGDAARFLRVGYEGLFYDEWQPAGYPAFLIGLRTVSRDLDVSIAIQHLLGLLTGLLLYAAARRGDVPRPWALVPAAFVLVSGDHLFFEHAILTETLWVTLLAGATYSLVRAVGSVDLRWLFVGSALLGLSAVVRNVSLFLPVLVAVWACFVFPGAWRDRLRAIGAVLAPAAVVVVTYSVLATSIGPYSGLGEMSGWSLYGRVGQFADCEKFDPPRGTRGLCEKRPVGERPGAFYYYFGGPDIPARKVFPALRPEDGELAGRFARAAILGQPVDYARTVGKDVLRFFDSQAGFDRDFSGSGPEAMSFRRTSPDPANTQLYASNVETKYSNVDKSPEAGTGLLETYQRVFRLNGLLLFAVIALSVVGVVAARGVARSVCLLVLPVGLFLLVLPPAVSAFEARYAVPPAMLMSISAAIGAAALAGTARRAPIPT